MRKADVVNVIEHYQTIKRLQEQVLIDGVHYGRFREIAKPSLYKAGAEVLMNAFEYYPTYRIISSTTTPDFVSYEVECVLRRLDDDAVVGNALGAANSAEAKYVSMKSAPRWVETDEPVPKNYWTTRDTSLLGGGKPYKRDDGKYYIKRRDENVDADVVDVRGHQNVILKMAEKRALVAAVLNVIGVSEYFTQDVEDMGFAQESSSDKTDDRS